METQLQTQKNPLKSFMEREAVKRKFTEMLGKRATSFITSVLQISTQNSLLANAEPSTIYNAAMVAATLDLPLNQNLGFAYIVPYKNNATNIVSAQFQMGYKGFIQLAQRTGLFKTISATPIYEGQIKENNPLTGIEFDFPAKTSETVIGYAAYFKLLNGFEKTLFLTSDEVKKHGSKYSKSFSHKSGLWITDFDSMAIKTVIKLLLSKYAPLSVDMQQAVVMDQAIINDAETQDITYIDNEEDAPLSKEQERLLLLIKEAETIEELKAFEEIITDQERAAYEIRLADLKLNEEAA